MHHIISRFRRSVRVRRYDLPVAFLILILCVGILPAPIQASGGGALLNSPYVTKFIDKDGRELYCMSTPVKPPEIKAPAVEIPQEASAVTLDLGNVPAFDWSYGCSATSAAMMFGYYDRIGYANIYTGPANGGVCPLDNSTWGHTVYPSVTCGECPISATHSGVDGRTQRGHVDDYWIDYQNSGPDPYLVNGWTEHSPFDCTGDFMGTSQSKYSKTDGNTSFYFSDTGSPLSNYTGCEPGNRDGCHGMRLFAESRGYTVLSNYTQLIQGAGSNPSLGFTFADYEAEIDAGRPVFIQVEGHTMLGVGYNTAGNLVYLHDTWDYSDHQMTWGGSYSGMAQWGVTVLRLAPISQANIALTSPNGGEQWGIGSSQTIAWTSQGISGNVKIEINRNYPSGSWEPLFASVPNDGSEPWGVTAPASTTCRMRISSLNDPSIQDTSAGNFVVAATSITVSLPNGGENWGIGSSRTIAWTSQGISGNVKIELSRDGGSSYSEVLAASVAVSARSWNWTVNGPASATCRIRITSLSNPSIFDASNGNFTIGSAPPATLYFQPNPKSTGSGAFSWELYLNGATGMKQFEFHLSFDKAFLNGTSFSPNAFFTQVAQNGFNNTTGTYDFAGASPTVYSGSWPMLVGTFQWNALQATNGTLVHFTSVLAQDASFNPIPVTSQDGTLQVPSGIFLNYNLTAGWNMIAVPLVLEDPSPEAVFPSGWPLYRWDALQGRYMGRSEITLAIGVGYWLKAPAAQTLIISGPGNEQAHAEVALFSGWNLIGAPYRQPVPWASVSVRKGAESKTLDQAISAGWIKGPFYQWNGVTYLGLTSGGTFQPTSGYWIKVPLGSCSLMFERPW